MAPLRIFTQNFITNRPTPRQLLDGAKYFRKIQPSEQGARTLQTLTDRQTTGGRLMPQAERNVVTFGYKVTKM